MNSVTEVKTEQNTSFKSPTLESEETFFLCEDTQIPFRLHGPNRARRDRKPPSAPKQNSSSTSTGIVSPSHDVTPDTADSFLAEEHRNALQKLQIEQSGLLNAIDSLRKEGIDKEIHIPQIIVCGDQSSGKSAVLEAISCVSFRSGTGTTTKFATELILRKSDQVSMKASIEPHHERPDTVKTQLRTFHRSADSISEFGNIQEAAGKHIRECSKSGTVWLDRLRIEVTGPDQPHLTLVDLPGLINANIDKASKDDIKAIRKLVRSFLESPRTIVLAVASARYDIDLQGVLSMIDENISKRTMGIITNPDGLQSTDAGTQWLKVANNEIRELGLGWHVVCNLSHEVADRSCTARDRNEEKVLSSSLWSELDEHRRGITALRHRLSEELSAVIRQELPSLMEELIRLRSMHEKVLEKTGVARTTFDSRKKYLKDILNNIQGLLASAIKADYEDSSGHRTFFTINPQHRLRDSIRCEIEEYVGIMQGSKSIVVSAEKSTVTSNANNQQHGPAYGGMPNEDDKAEIMRRLLGLKFNPPVDLHKEVTPSSPWREPDRVPLKQACTDIIPRLKNNRGRGLPGNVPQASTKSIFNDLSEHWQVISQQYTRSCLQIVRNTMRAAFLSCAGKHTGELLWKELGVPYMTSKEELLGEKLEELMAPYNMSFLMTFRVSDYLARRHHRELDSSFGPDCGSYEEYAVMMKYSDNLVVAAAAYDEAEAFYEIALETFTENFAALAIERCLMHRLPDIVRYDVVDGLTEEKVNELGREPNGVEVERERARKQIAILAAAIDVCRDSSVISTELLEGVGLERF